MADNKLVLSAEGPEARLGILETGVLVEYFLERSRERGITGNIYKARVSRVLPGMQAAFVDLGNTVERKAYLYVADILGAGDERRLLEGYDGGDDEEEDDEDEEEEAAEKPKHGRGPKKRRRESQKQRKIEDLLKEGQEILVQIVKEPVGQKG